MSRFNYKIVTAGDGRFAIIRELASGDVAGYDAVAARNDEQRHFAIYRSHGILHAAADSRTYDTRDEAERVLAGMDDLSAAQAFDLRVIGRAEHGGKTWIVFDDGAYRHVVEETHFLASGHRERERDDETRADDYTDWCGRGVWATDEVAAAVAALCDMTHVHSATSGGCGRVDAATHKIERCRSHETGSTPQAWESVFAGTESEVVGRWWSEYAGPQASGDRFRVVDVHGTEQELDEDGVVGPVA